MSGHDDYGLLHFFFLEFFISQSAWFFTSYIDGVALFSFLSPHPLLRHFMSFFFSTFEDFFPQSRPFLWKLVHGPSRDEDGLFYTIFFNSTMETEFHE